MDLRCKYITTLVVTVLQVAILVGIVTGWGPINYVLKNENLFSSGCPKHLNLTENRNFIIKNLYNSTNGSCNDLNLWEFRSKDVIQYCVTSNLSTDLKEFYNISSRLYVHNSLNNKTHTLSWCTKSMVSSNMCSSQNKQLDLIYTMGVICRIFSGTVWGFMYDYFGTWVCEGIGTLLVFIGYLSTSFVKPNISSVLFVSIPLIKIGGRFIIDTNFPVANLFGKKRKFVLLILTTAVGTSPWLATIIKLLFDDGYGISYSFLAFAVISLLFIPKTFFLMPRMHIPHVIPDNFDYGLCISHKVDDTDSSTENLLVDDLPIEIGEEGKTFRECVMSLPFIAYSLCQSIILLRYIFAIGTQYPWLMSLINDQSVVSYYLNIFGFLPLANVVISPVVAIAVEKILQHLRNKQLPDVEVFRYSAMITFTMVATTFLLASALVLIPYVPIQGMSFILFDLGKILFTASLPNFLMAYYPRKYFGKMMSVLSIPVSLVIMLQYLMYASVIDFFHGNFIYINAILLILTLCTFVCPAVMYFN